jgi:hypothetical protein
MSYVPVARRGIFGSTSRGVTALTPSEALETPPPVPSRTLRRVDERHRAPRIRGVRGVGDADEKSIRRGCLLT